ncbi:MAG: histidine kinase, partial [Flavobacteriaceae bacterium]|nr:histidine kinase [Flavobacteriaceae bacterium]
MQFSKSNFFLFFLIGWCSFLLAQKQHSINYTSAKDLPNNTIRSLLLDHQGVLWIGTDNGLVKKVNNNFTTYFEEDGLAQNNIWAIAEDNKNNLWLGSFGGGVSIFDGLQFKVINKINGLVHNDVTQLYLFKNFMYVGTYDGLSLIEINTHKVLSAKPKTVKPFKISSFFTYKNQLYCNTVWTGLYKIEVMDNSIELTLVNTQNSIAFFKDKDTIYNSLNGTLFKTTLENYTAKSPKVPQEWGHSIIWDYAKDFKNSLFAAARGLFTNDGGIYEIINNQLVSKAHDFNIPSKNILSLEYDARFQKLYVGSIDLGLFEVDLNSSIQFYEFPQQKVLGIEFVRNTPVFLLSDGLHFTHQQHKKQVLLQQFKQWQEHYINTTKSPLPKHEDYFYEIDYQTPPKDIKFYDLKLFQNQFWINTNIGIYTLNADGTLYNYLPVHTEELNFTPSGQLIETNPYHGLRVYQSVKEFGFKYYDENDINTPTMVVNSLQHQHKTYLLSVFSGLYVWKDHRFISYLKNNIWDETKLRHITDLDKNIAISTEFGDVFIVNDVKEFHILKKIPR